MKWQKTIFQVSALAFLSMAFHAACATSTTTSDFGGNGGTRDASSGSSGDGGSSSNSSGDDSGGSSGSGDDSGGSSSGGNPNGGGSSSGGTPMSDADCQALSANMCLGCCQQLRAPGPTTLFNAIQACVCGDAGACASSCATEYCQMAGKVTSANDPCAKCILNDVAPDAGQCAASVNSTCQADSNCSAYVTCAQGCPP